MPPSRLTAEIPPPREVIQEEGTRPTHRAVDILSVSSGSLEFGGSRQPTNGDDPPGLTSISANGAQWVLGTPYYRDRGSMPQACTRPHVEGSSHPVNQSAIPMYSFANTQHGLHPLSSVHVGSLSHWDGVSQVCRGSNRPPFGPTPLGGSSMDLANWPSVAASRPTDLATWHMAPMADIAHSSWAPYPSPLLTPASMGPYPESYSASPRDQSIASGSRSCGSSNGTPHQAPMDSRQKGKRNPTERDRQVHGERVMADDGSFALWGTIGGSNPPRGRSGARSER